MTDIEIANKAFQKDIREIAKIIGVEDNIELYGTDKAKIKFDEVERKANGKLILVTSINPTPYGEGKTTVSIGLNDGLNQLGKKSIAVLREPSMGPVFGIKGGATGGGYSQVIPMEDINLHFTGDFHAITACNNLIASAIDNHLYFGNVLDIDTEQICFRRCLDINDRALREVGLKERKERFQITAASEVMSILCLSRDFLDLKKRLAHILVAYSKCGSPIYVKDLKLEGALATILKDAIKPNLVQSLENNPVLIHGGPFANIACGCNSIIATKLGLKLSDYVVTEAGFGSDLGAEKFLNIKCRQAQLKPDAIVIVATCRALKHHGGVKNEDISLENLDALKKGLSNLEVHIENMLQFTTHVIVTLNQYATDSMGEINMIKEFVEKKKIPFAVNETYLKGGVGAEGLALEVMNIVEKENDFQFLYSDDLSIQQKIEIIAKKIYHTSLVHYDSFALLKLKKIEALGYSNLPICVAKTQYSISDNPNLLGYPKDYDLHVRDIEVYTGAGFIVVYLGNIMTMPGLSKSPNYERIDIDEHYQIKGLF